MFDSYGYDSYGYDDYYYDDFGGYDYYGGDMGYAMPAPRPMAFGRARAMAGAGVCNVHLLTITIVSSRKSCLPTVKISAENLSVHADMEYWLYDKGQ